MLTGKPSECSVLDKCPKKSPGISPGNLLSWIGRHPLKIGAVRIVFFSFLIIESNSYRWSQRSPVVSTC